MDANTIIRLLDAGYTKSDIDRLINVSTSGDAAAVQQLPDNAEQLKAPESSVPVIAETEQPEASSPQTNTEVDALRAVVDGLKEQLSALTQAVHKNNIINSEQPAKTPEETVSDILAALINPHYKKE